MRYAICNETFEGWDHPASASCIAGLGYTGLEIAPFTLAARITDVSPERRRELKQQAEDHGIRAASACTGCWRRRPDCNSPRRMLGVRTGDGGVPGRAGQGLRRPGRRHPRLRLAGPAAHPGGSHRENRPTENAVDTFRRAAAGHRRRRRQAVPRAAVAARGRLHQHRAGRPWN